jgi:lambda family phage portal protein
MRERSRNWKRNDEHGRRFSTLVKNGAVGPEGFKLKMRCGDNQKTKDGYKFVLDTLANDAIEAWYKKWCMRGNCDVTGRYSFAELCRLAVDTCAFDGEYVIREVLGGKKEPYKLQFLATERLDVRRRTPPYQGTDVRMGIERNTVGKAVAYYLLNYSPTDPRDLGMLNSAAPERVPADQVIHDFITMDAEQIRGVPWSHAVLMGAHLLHGFEESAVYAARTGASHMGFYTQTAQEGAPINVKDVGATEDVTTGDLSTDMEPGLMQVLPAGVDFKSFDAKYPSEAFAPFANNRKHTMSAGLDITYHSLTGDLSQVNYSSARIGELLERDNWRAVQQWMISGLVYRSFSKALEMALLAGQVVMPNGSPLPISKLEKFLEGTSFQGRGWDWVDPLKEAQAAKLARDEGFTTRTKIVAAKGGDFEDVIIELAMEAELLAKHKVTLGEPQPTAQPATRPAAGKGSPNQDNAADQPEKDDN